MSDYRLEWSIQPDGQYRAGQCYLQLPRDPFAWPPPLQIGLSPIPSVDCFGWHYANEDIGIEGLSLEEPGSLLSLHADGDGFLMAGCAIGKGKVELFRLLLGKEKDGGGVSLHREGAKVSAVYRFEEGSVFGYPVESTEMALSLLSGSGMGVRGALLFGGWLLVKVVSPHFFRRSWLAMGELVMRVEGVGVGEPLDAEAAQATTTTTTMQRAEISSSSGLQLPACPVCLDRMDSQATGISERFYPHLEVNPSCPVCQRLSQAIQCAICHSTQQVWQCLLCGLGGCGRYHARHAHAHFQITGHNWAIEQATHRVWDYLGDRHVHRMIKDQQQQQRVEIPAPDDFNLTDADKKGEQKKQSEADHEWCEARIAALERLLALRESQWVTEREHLESKHAKLLAEWEAEREDWEAESLCVQEQGLRAQQECNLLKATLRNLTSELKMERSLSQQMAMNQEVYQDMLQRRDATIRDLEEQIRDLIGHLQAAQLLNQLGGGDIIIQEKTPAKSQRSNRSKGS